MAEAPEHTAEEKPEPTGRERRDMSPEGIYRRSIFGVPVTVTVSIGRQRMPVSELLELRAGSVLPLQSRIEDPVDLIVEDKLVAKGELLETEDGGIAVKITEIPEQSDD